MRPLRNDYWRLKTASLGAAAIVSLSVIAPIVADDDVVDETHAIDLQVPKAKALALVDDRIPTTEQTPTTLPARSSNSNSNN